MNIIIPIGGAGERFAQENYDVPKPLIPVLGTPNDISFAEIIGREAGRSCSHHL